MLGQMERLCDNPDISIRHTYKIEQVIDYLLYYLFRHNLRSRMLSLVDELSDHTERNFADPLQIRIMNEGFYFIF
jgi:hypothetical protein